MTHSRRWSSVKSVVESPDAEGFGGAGIYDHRLAAACDATGEDLDEGWDARNEWELTMALERHRFHFVLTWRKESYGHSRLLPVLDRPGGRTRGMLRRRGLK